MIILCGLTVAVEQAAPAWGNLAVVHMEVEGIGSDCTAGRDMVADRRVAVGMQVGDSHIAGEEDTELLRLPLDTLSEDDETGRLCGKFTQWS